jgi:hypothetical protein
MDLHEDWLPLLVDHTTTLHPHIPVQDEASVYTRRKEGVNNANIMEEKR